MPRRVPSAYPASSPTVLLAALALAAVPLSGCSTGSDTPGGAGGSGASTATPSPLPTPATGRLTDAQSRALFDTASAALRAQRTASISLRLVRLDGGPLSRVLTPTVRLDARDPARVVAASSLTVLAANVAAGGRVYRQEPDPSGRSTVWVIDPEPRTALEFVLWKPGSPTAAVAYLGAESVAGRSAYRYRVFDPTRYRGPTTGPAAPIPPTATATPSAVPTAPAAPTPGAGSTPGGGPSDYDDFWLDASGQLLREASVIDDLAYVSTRIEYGGDLHIDVPDPASALTAEEYARRGGTPSSSRTTTAPAATSTAPGSTSGPGRPGPSSPTPFLPGATPTTLRPPG